MKSGLLGILYTQLITRPVFNILIIFLAIFGGNLGLSIILITLVLRLSLINFTSASSQMSHKMSDLQPKLDEISKKYENDPERMAKETIKIFKSEGKSPMKGCLKLFIQIPIIMGLYTVIRRMTEGAIDQNWLYSFFYSFGNVFISDAAELNTNIQNTFLGIDLFKNGNIILSIIITILTFFQTELTTLAQPKQAPMKGPNGEALPDMSKMMGGMSYFMAIIMGFTFYQLQAAISLYIITSTLFSIGQYSWQYRSLLHAKWLEWRGKPTIVKG